MVKQGGVAGLGFKAWFNGASRNINSLEPKPCDSSILPQTYNLVEQSQELARMSYNLHS